MHTERKFRQQPRKKLVIGETYIGKVKCFFPDKHYGFIIVKDHEDCFFHDSEIVNQEPLQEGTWVDFWVVDGRNPGEVKASEVQVRHSAA